MNWWLTVLSLVVGFVLAFGGSLWLDYRRRPEDWRRVNQRP